MSVIRPNADEYRAAREDAAWVDLSDRELIRVNGPDRKSFVHGMVTQDVEGLPAGMASFATAITVKGAMVADLRLLQLPDDVVLDCDPGRGGAVKEFLEKYLISEEAEVHPASDWSVLGFVGPNAHALRSRVPAGAVIGELPRAWGGGLDVVVKREAVEAVKSALGAAVKLSAETAEVLRVEDGAPKWGSELTETTIPLEANLGRAIHYQKGCYIGQEVIARATFRGQMARRLAWVELGEQELAPGTELKLGEKKAGWLSTVVASPKHRQNVALAFVHRDALAAGTVLQAGTGTAKVLGVTAEK